MPSGDNPNSRKNLEKGVKTRFVAGEKQVEIARRGQRAAAESLRRTRTLREAVKALLDVGCTDEKVAEFLRSIGLEPTNRNAATFAMLGRALSGSEKAYEVLRDTAGEQPKLQVGISAGDDVAADDLRGMSDAELAALASESRDALPAPDGGDAIGVSVPEIGKMPR